MSIRIGLSTPATLAASAGDFWQWVDYCEQTGVDSLWHSDQLISRHNTLESLSVMAALAGRTQRIKFGLNAVTVNFRDPLVLAKQFATIDFLSGGRLLPVLGIGSGGAPEWAATAQDKTVRGRKANEVIAILSGLLSQDSFSYEGEFYHYQDVSITPKPVQTPLPLWIGGNSDAAVRRTARFGTGWQSALSSPEQTGEIISRIKAELKNTRRHIAEDHYGATVPFRFGEWSDQPVQSFTGALKLRSQGEIKPLAAMAVGNAQAIRAVFQAYVEQGVSKFVAVPLTDSPQDAMNQTRQLCSEVLPAIETGRKRLLDVTA